MKNILIAIFSLSLVIGILVKVAADYDVLRPAQSAAVHGQTQAEVTKLCRGIASQFRFELLRVTVTPGMFVKGSVDTDIAICQFNTGSLALTAIYDPSGKLVDIQ